MKNWNELEKNPYSLAKSFLSPNDYVSKTMIAYRIQSPKQEHNSLWISQVSQKDDMLDQLELSFYADRGYFVRTPTPE